MANGRIIRGIDGILSLTTATNSATPGVTEEIPCLQSWTLETSASVTEENATCMASNGDGGSDVGGAWNETWVEGRSFSLSSEHFWQSDQAAGATAIVDVDRVGEEMTFKLYPNGNATGAVVYEGKAHIESISTPSEVNGKIMQSLSYKGNGALTKSIAP